MDLLIPNKEEGITIQATTVDQVKDAPQRCIAWWPFCEAHLQDVRLLHHHRVDIMWLPLLLPLKHTWAWSMRVRVSIWQNSNTWTWKLMVNLPSIKSTEERSKFCSVRLLNKSTEVSKKWRAFHIFLHQSFLRPIWVPVFGFHKSSLYSYSQPPGLFIY